MNILEISDRIKQRPPFQMIEKVLEIKPLQYAKGIKNVSVNEAYFAGHFPQMPIMPGVLIVEAAAQLCSVVMSYGEIQDDKIPVLLKIDEMKYVKAVIPGDTLVIEVSNIQNTIALTKFNVKVTSDNKKVSVGTLSFTFVDKHAIYGESSEE